MIPDSVGDDIFRSSDYCGFARAANVMSTKSPTDFEWSVKIIADGGFCVGIASELQRKDHRVRIDEYDENAILYGGYTGYNMEIVHGFESIHEDLKAHESGDIIRFRFQPKRKKLLIELVSF